MSENTESELPAGGEEKWPRVIVRNFGPIATGEVELRPLTVLAGPSNTGKSWLATLFYAVTRQFNESYALRHLTRRIRSGPFEPDDTGLENFPEDPAAWLQSLQDHGAWRLTARDKQTLGSFLESEQDRAFQNQILHCFGLAKAHDLIREGNAEAASVTFMNAVTPGAFTIRQRLMIDGEGGSSLDVDVMTDEYRPPQGSTLEKVRRILANLVNASANTEDKPPRRYSRSLSEELLDLLTYYSSHPSSYYLPAARSGVMHAHRAMISAFIQRASRPNLTRRSSLPALSGVLANFLGQLVELADDGFNVPSTGDPSVNAASSLERTVLGGRIDIETNDVGYPNFTYRPDGWKRDLSLMSVSSMVSELAPVALYLRHYVRQGDLLILEEPEAHLHPAMQVRFVREITGWVRHGIRVLITTHSEWVVEAIANIIAEAKTDKTGGLPQQDVGVWQFEMSTHGKVPGSRIREVEWDPDEGGFSVGFGAVANDLINDWADLLEAEE